MSSYRQTHRSFHNHTHRHQQQQRSCNPRNVPRRPGYQFSRRRHHNVHDDPRVNDSSFEGNGSYTATDHHQNLAPRFQDLHLTPVSVEVIEVLPSVVVNNHSPYGLNSSSAMTTYNEQVDEVDVAIDHWSELNETSGMLDNTNDMVSQQIEETIEQTIERTISFFSRLCRRAPSYYLNGINRLSNDFLMMYLKIRTHSALAKDGVHPEGVVADLESSEMCAICQSEYEPEDNIGTLRCGHEYHVGCIKEWLLKKKDCPICRASVLPY